MPSEQHAVLAGERRSSKLGSSIFQRYELLRKIGEGAHGEVYEADDTLARRKVAVKILRDGEAQLSARRESAVLRLLRLRGVVQLLDEGTDDDRHVIVTELIDGAPFPGEIAAAWSHLSERVVSLLEIIGRVHQAGIVHRDLKPSNVLVDRAGRVHILDFGISASRDEAASSVPRLGTLEYLAPEVLTQRAPDHRADLYAVGVMIYECLSGVSPHRSTSAEGLLRTKMTIRPERLDASSAVPRHVADVVDRLLAPYPNARPSSAAEVLQLLGHEDMRRRAPKKLPRLGDARPLDELCRAARERQSLDIWGPWGSGKTRLLGDAADILAAEGFRIARPGASRVPFGSLAEIIGTADQLRVASIDEALEAAGDRLIEWMRQRGLIFADDFEMIDRWSAQVLEGARTHGAVIRALRRPTPDSIQVSALDQKALSALFAEPDRIFHLREDAAFELWHRTEGLPELVAQEIAAWVRAGVAHWADDRLHIDRASIELLKSGLFGADAEGRRLVDREALSDLQAEVLSLIAVARGKLTTQLIAQLVEQPHWLVDATTRELIELAYVRALPDGSLLAVARVDLASMFDMERRRDVHRKIAGVMSEGSESRMMHIAAADDTEAAVQESLVVSQKKIAGGNLGEATAAIHEGLVLVRKCVDSAGLEEELLSVLVRLAIAQASPGPLDRALYELSRATVKSERVAALESMAQAALLALRGDGERGLEVIDRVPGFVELELELSRQSVRVLAAHRGPIAREVELLEESRMWAEASGSVEVRACHAGWMGRLSYRLGDFVKAAELHALEASARRGVAKISALLFCASAWLEAFELERAAELAAEAKSLAIAARHPLYEARAEWIRRAVSYRSKQPSMVDLELVSLAEQLGVLQVMGLIILNEAAIAWRGGDLRTARDLATRAAARWSEAATPAAAALSRSLALVSGVPADHGEISALAEHAEALPIPSVALQVLGLLARCSPDVRAASAPARLRLLVSVPPQFRAIPMEILSADEAVEDLAI